MQGFGVPIWLRLARVYHKTDRLLIGQLRAHDLSLAQFDVLAQVSGAEGLTQQELADKLLVTKGNVCQLLDRMEQGGWLRRQQDGRANRVYLTEQGYRLTRDTMPEHEALLERIFSALAPEEQRQLSRLLRKVDHALSDVAGG